MFRFLSISPQPISTALPAFTHRSSRLANSEHRIFLSVFMPRWTMCFLGVMRIWARPIFSYWSHWQGEMFPGVSIDNSGYSPSAQVILTHQFRWEGPIRILLPNFHDHDFIRSRMPVILTLPILCATALLFVIHIFLIGSCAEVLWIATGWIIAGVEYIGSLLGYRPKRENIGNFRSGARTFPIYKNTPIPLSINESRERPTCIDPTRPVDLLPESIFEFGDLFLTHAGIVSQNVLNKKLVNAFYGLSL